MAPIKSQSELSDNHGLAQIIQQKVDEQILTPPNDKKRSSDDQLSAERDNPKQLKNASNSPNKASHPNPQHDYQHPERPRPKKTQND